MGTLLERHIGAANELTARWCATAGTGDFVLSGAGVWPLLALLASAADEPTRSELSAAVGLPADAAHTAALRLLRTLADAEDLSAALGIWVREDLPLHQDWAAQLPAGTIDHLAGQDVLDSWTERHTRGLIDRFPLRIDPATLLVLATALVAKTSWQTPFTDAVLQPKTGPWTGISGRGLRRSTGELADAAILDGPQPVTRVVITGTADIDVHLLLGSGTPGTVLAVGLAALAGSIPIRTALPVGTTGPGLVVAEKISTGSADRLEILVPPFDIRSAHDLCALPELFGLSAATDSDTGHFPSISPVPLYIVEGAQDVLARFTREGFETAAVTSFALTRAAALRRHQVTTVAVTFDRPFGFLAVHRPTGLVVTAGWVANLSTGPTARN